MDYQIGDFSLDVNQNQLASSDSCQSVRPKTMALLLYFIQHREQVLSKQTLLQEVWKSAGAQEHVLFQSIKEIRELFAPLNVIKTHPRVGYQWLVPVTKITAHQSTDAPAGIIRRLGIGPAVAAFLAVVITFTQVLPLPPTEKASDNPLPPSLSREIVVLPFTVEMDGNREDWVRLGAMDMMINKLRGLGQFAVPNAEDVMMAIARSETFDMQDIERQSYAVRTQVGESVTLHAKLLGAPMEYQLHYSLIGRYHTKQGVLFGDTVGQLLDNLTKDILGYYQLAEDSASTSVAQQSADYSLLQAMEGFHRGHLDKAEVFFNAYLHSHGDNLTAQRYLVKVKIAKGELEGASILAQQALSQAQKQANHQEIVRLLFEMGVIASLQKDNDNAYALLSQSRELAQQHRDTLYTAFAHTQLGHLLVQQQQYSQAKDMYQQALAYHRGFRCPYGQISNLHALSMLYANENNHQQSEAMLDEAITIARNNELIHEHAHLLLNKIGRGVAGEQQHLWLEQAEKLIAQLDDSDYKRQFVARLKQLNGSSPSP